MDVDRLVRRVQQEFVEMPGLRLTPQQASRLWGLEGDTCRAVIEVLVSKEENVFPIVPAGANSRDMIVHSEGV